MGKQGHRISKEVKTESDRAIYGWLGAGSQGAPTFSEFSRLQRQNKDLLEIVGERTLKLSEAQKKR